MTKVKSQITASTQFFRHAQCYETFCLSAQMPIGCDAGNNEIWTTLLELS